MYSRPIQCSPLLRAKIEGGWVTARSSAIEGRRERVDTSAHLLRAEVQVLEDRVAIRAGGGRVDDRGGELLAGQADVLGRARQPVAGQAGGQVLEQRAVTAQVRGEQRAQA